MTIGRRLTLWYGGILAVSLLIMAAVVHHELLEQSQITSSGSKPDPAWNETGEVMLFYGLPTAAVLLVGGAWMLKKSLTPIRALTQSAEQLRVQNLEERLPRSGNGDELDRLTQVFNEMTARLHESFATIRDFTLHASHELKTPLTLMRAQVETALRDPNCPGNVRNLLADQLDEIQRLAKIVDGLAFLARVESGSAPWAKEPVRLDELVKDSIADAQALAAQKNILVTQGACDAVEISGDRHRLRQLLLNLVSNAISYNEPDGWITFDLQRKSENAQLKIANSGPGIPPEALPRVFDRFFRADASRNREIDGCGLGLSIAKSIVLAHGGCISIDSTPNSETVATVQLPLGERRPSAENASAPLGAAAK